MTQELLLAVILPEENLQVRCPIDETVVADYADRLRTGAPVTPITVFTDGESYFLAKGHHRYLAAHRLGHPSIMADVHEGTHLDAMWFALGANRAKRTRQTEHDKQHAIAMALALWPDKVQRDIAKQIGCSAGLVSKVVAEIAIKNDGPPLVGRNLRTATQWNAIRERLLAGQSGLDIRRELGASTTMMASVRRELAVSSLDTSRPAVQLRRAQMREMAAAGHSSPQIAAAVGISEESIRETFRKEGVAVPGDKLTRGLRHHDSNRIMEQIVADADNLGAAANFIDFTVLDRTQLAEWVGTLRQARVMLGTFIRRLTKEKVIYDGEVVDAAAQTLEDPRGPDRADACPAGADGPA